MDKLGLLFKALPERDLVGKSIGCKGGKKSTKSLTAPFFVTADGSKISEPIVIWNKHLGQTRPSMHELTKARTPQK